MRPQHFDSESDFPPMPFGERICRLAWEIKKLGLTWKPHVGCFVWDPDRHIKADSPFPDRIYFILSMPRFIDIFGSTEAIVEKLVWLPTWHQARLLCRNMGIANEFGAKECIERSRLSPCEDLERVYLAIIEALRGQKLNR